MSDAKDGGRTAGLSSREFTAAFSRKNLGGMCKVKHRLQ